MRKDARHPSVLDIDIDKDRTQIASTNFDRSCSPSFREKIDSQLSKEPDYFRSAD